MIDFRYHLVSLVAVFMALAVGIVLGAGPLGQEISSTLEAQVRELREERNDLRAQLDQAEARDRLKGETIAIVTPTLTSNQLTGRRVAVVTLPGADRNIVGQLQDQIATAGGQVVQTARLDDSWADPESAPTRHEVAAELSPALTDPEPRDGAEPTAETVIAAALTGEEAVAGSGAWRSATDRLEEVGFVDTSWADDQDEDFAEPPDTFVIVTGTLSAVQVEEDEGGYPELQQSLDLIAAFGALGAPTLVAGYGTESYADPVQAAQSPVIRGVRAESAIAETVSSVDNVEGPAGQLAAVLGLRWAVEGAPGHWGLGTDAQGSSPTVPAPLEVEAEAGDPGPVLPEDPTDPDDATDPASPTLPGQPLPTGDIEQGPVQGGGGEGTEGGTGATGGTDDTGGTGETGGTGAESGSDGSPTTGAPTP